MANARDDKSELIKLLPFELEGVDMIDIRFWKKTTAGPRPTKRGIAVREKMLVPLIVGLQRVLSQVSSEAAKEEAGVR